MNFPADLKYTKEHEWIRVDGDHAVVGITDFAQKELGDIIYVDIDSVGDTLDQNAIFGSVEAVKTVSDLFLPVGAEILEVNALLKDQPELVNKDPYGDGWMVKCSVDNASDIDALLSAADYKKLVGA